MSQRNLSSQQFFHGSADVDGLSFLRTEDYVHVGTRRAALSRVDPLKWEPDESPRSEDLAAGRSRVYSMELKPDAKIAPHLYTDSAANRGAIHPRGYDAYRYVNEYEDPGSESLLVRPQALSRVRPVGRTSDLLRQEPDYPYKDDLP